MYSMLPLGKLGSGKASLVKSVHSHTTSAEVDLHCGPCLVPQSSPV
jgi:hypothetical protein